jgi:hypothetical protein
MIDKKYEDTPITNWFKIKNKDYIPSPKYFYYNHSENLINFSVERPKNYYKIGSIRWNKYDTMLNICCSKNTWKFSNKNKNKITYFRNLVFDKFKKDQIPILKSNLQKCVRRKLINPSISTALTLLCLDSSQLLRRLPIIMLEDAMLNNDILLLIWLVCAHSKGFSINDFFMLKIINMVHFLAKNEFRESYGYLDKFNLKKYKLNDLNNNEKNILWALQLRCSYGGMTGDIRMINFFTKKWFNRFNEQFILEDNPNALNIEDLRIMTLNDIHVSSIDFHCTNIIKFIKNKYPNYSESEIKNSIWYNRSNKNYREYLIDEKNLNTQNIHSDSITIINANDVWKVISDYVNYISKVILKNYFIQ